MRYLPHTEEDVRQMLERIGVKTLDDLFSEIPAEVRLQRPIDLPEALSEAELLKQLRRMTAEHAATPNYSSFLGGGAYHHFIPAVVDQLASRSEFYTAYTPYQPEISQGTLQAIFEYQTLICQLTGMDVANASMYDGASACAEAVLMAARATRRKKILLSSALHPEYRQTVATYCSFLEMELVEVPLQRDGRTDPQAAAGLVDDTCAALVAGYPNFFGCIEDLAALGDAAHKAGSMLVTAVQEPVALGILKSPGELGADIVIGEGQSLGLPVSFGGPGIGFFAARQKVVRSMPGRLIGETVDGDGQRGFVLTLATREQHIRREKATSNICSNQGLCALMVTVYLALLGKQGLRDLAVQNLSKAAYAKQQIAGLEGFNLPFSAPGFNEFVVESEHPVDELLKRVEEKKILGGIPLARFYPDMPNRFLVCVTEQNSRAEINALVAALEGGKA